MARAALHMKVRELAALAGLSPVTVTMFEGGRIRPKPETLASIRKVFEGKGIEFLGSDAVRATSQKF